MGCGSSRVTLLALNIANGFGPAYRTPEARLRQAEFVAGQAPDVLALSEVDVGCARSGGADTALEVVRLLPPGLLLYAPAGQWDGGTIGNALWVSDRLAVRSWGWTELPVSEGEWPRVAVWARVEGAGLGALVLATHLSAGYSEEVRRRQLGVIAVHEPDVVMGDLNAYREEVAPLLPELIPNTPDEIDAVWSRWAWNGALVPTRGASDHPWAARVDAQ